MEEKKHSGLPYPRDRIDSSTKLPIGKAFGRFALAIAKCFFPTDGHMFAAYANDTPELFVDLEHPREEYSEQMPEAEVHFGIRANFHAKPLDGTGSMVSRVDLYMSLSELEGLIAALVEIRSNNESV